MSDNIIQFPRLPKRRAARAKPPRGSNRDRDTKIQLELTDAQFLASARVLCPMDPEIAERGPGADPLMNLLWERFLQDGEPPPVPLPRRQ
jgi:hypothetical protein